MRHQAIEPDHLTVDNILNMRRGRRNIGMNKELAGAGNSNIRASNAPPHQDNWATPAKPDGVFTAARRDHRAPAPHAPAKRHSGKNVVTTAPLAVPSRTAAARDNIPPHYLPQDLTKWRKNAEVQRR